MAWMWVSRRRLVSSRDAWREEAQDRRPGVGSTFSSPMGVVWLSGRDSSSASSMRATKRAKMRWHSASDVENGSSAFKKRRGVRDLVREDGVGVEAAKNGSVGIEVVMLLDDEFERGRDVDAENEEEGRSSRDGGLMPSSV
jgi:hypothetical protein